VGDSQKRVEKILGQPYKRKEEFDIGGFCDSMQYIFISGRIRTFVEIEIANGKVISVLLRKSDLVR